MRTELARKIAERLTRDEAGLRRHFTARETEPFVGTRYFLVDDLLPETIAREIHASFPRPDRMRLLNSFREKKYTTKSLGELSKILGDITFAFQAAEVVAAVERVTGMKEQHPDEKLYAGGLSLMVRDHFLHPHIDNSHESTRSMYRTLNLLYYVSPDWNAENGGNLELWDPLVRTRVTIPSLFNRLVVMETNHRSWHSVSRVRVERGRSCVSNYYFSPFSPDGGEYFHVTSFSAPPNEPLKRILARADNAARHLLRRVFRRGVGQKDLFEPKPMS
jgi:Rps23 Pro-64 3,4-dihydroxylase Tpa1-like proline 4-hydroxylase